ncbi:MAG: amino acid ABC transporter permease, partial [Planctomycetes bacterium]|nr:amino acid ABC transporter permease [Planctomycetota bacterium]
LVGCIALGLNSGAYLGEIFRGGILSIDRGQREAALSLGMSEYQSMRYVVLPQALTNALPALGNEFVTLIKDSSLLSVISVNELTYRAQLVGGRRFEYFTMYIGIGLIYFVICFTLSRYLDRVEKKMRTGQK